MPTANSRITESTVVASTAAAGGVGSTLPIAAASATVSSSRARAGSVRPPNTGITWNAAPMRSMCQSTVPSMPKRLRPSVVVRVTASISRSRRRDYFCPSFPRKRESTRGDVVSGGSPLSRG
jgi:hypothetical protein